MGFLKKLNKTIKDTLDIDIEKEARQLIKDTLDEVDIDSSGKLLNTAKGLFSGLNGTGTSNSNKPAAERQRQEVERQRQAAERERKAEIEAREEELDAGFSYTLRSGGTVRGLQEAFTEDYPYLRIGVYMVKTGQGADRHGGEISSYDSDTSFGDIRSFKGECKVRIEGRSTPQSLEKQFREVSGLVIKICYNDEDDNRFYISMDSSKYKKHICDINREFREAGYNTADIS